MRTHAGISLRILFLALVLGSVAFALQAQAATVATPSFSKKHGFYDASISVQITSSTSGAAIRYTTDGSKPTASYGTTLGNGGSVTIATTRCLRAVAYKSGMTDSKVMTQTYIFTGAVINQPNNPAGFPAEWYRWQWWDKYGKEPADYGMDSRILSQYGATRLKNSLKALPSLSIVLKRGDMFHDSSLVVYGQSPRSTITEKAASVELIYPDDPNKGFQVDCAIRSHSWTQTKRALRMKLKSEFGPTQLDYPLFERAPIHATTKQGFQNIIIRSGGNDNWGEASGSTYTRDPWAIATQREMSGLGSHGIFVHLYINGLYWGIYNPVERPDASYAAMWFGGSKSDWFAGHHAGDIDGNDDRYDQLIAYAQQGNYAQVQNYMDMDKFFDYLLLAWYNGHVDWPRNNYYYINRNNPPGKVMWVNWDAEYSWDLTGQPINRVNSEFRPGADSKYPLTKIWHGLRGNSQFIKDFSRRVDLHCYGSGVLTESKCQARWDLLCNHLDEAIYAECARWGDVKDGVLVKHSHWEADRDRVRSMMNGSVGRLVSDLKSCGYYVEPSNPPPTAPSSLAASALDSTRIRVTWSDNSSNESGFKLDRRVSGASSWNRVATPGANVTTYTDSGLADGTTYYSTVKAYNGDGDSGYSNVDDATTPVELQPPAAPDNPSATAVSTTQIRFTWRDNSGDEADFYIRRSLDGSDFYALPAIIVAANTTSYSDTGLTPNTPYWYKVKARNAAGESAYTAAASATTQQATPIAPSNLAASALDSSRIRVTWNDNSGSEDGYKLDRRQSGASTWERPATLSANATTYTDSGLPEDTTFYYKVKAYNGGGNSEYSNVGSATTPVDLQPPAAPDNPSATAVSTTEIRFTWRDNSGDEADFYIRRSLDGSDFYALPAIIVAANTTSYSDTGLTPNTPYWYKVKARNAAGESAYTAAAGATTQQAAPSAPSSLAASALDTSRIKVTWQDNSGSESGFKLDRRQSGASTWERPATLAANATTYTDSGLPADTTFYYKVKAYNAGGNSDYSNVDGAKTQPEPVPAIAVSTTSIAVSCEEGTDAADTTFQVWNGDAATLAYNVVESSSKLDVSPTSGTSTGSSDKQTHTVTFHTADLAVGTHDRSINVEDDGSGAANGPITIAVQITVTARPLDPPAAPSAVAATALSASELAVSWQDNSDNETGFKLDRRQTMTDTWVRVGTLAADATSYTDSGLLTDTTFYYKVKAYNADGDSAYSAVAGAKTEPALQPPAMPGNPTATALSTTEILFTWQDNSDVEESLLLRRSLDGVDFYALPATVIPADATSYTDTGLSPDTECWYKIKARNAAGESAYTAPVSATTEPEPPQPATPFAAYNDLAWAEGQRSANITTYTRGEGGPLKNYADGATLGATLTLNMGGDFTGPTMGAEPAAGTDAANVFGGIVDCLGLISYGATDLTLTFSGLDPALLYEVVVFGNRNNPDYTDRITKNAISGADTFVNASSAGTDFSGPSDTSTAVANGYNTQKGHVARFIDVQPGADGEFQIRVYDNESPSQPKFYVSAVMLKAYELAQADSDGDGLSDGDEYVMGTSAQNPDEYLAVRLGLVAGQLTASFDTIVAEGAGYEGKTRYYALERCTDIAAGTWTAVSGYDRVQATGQPQNCTLADPEPAAVFRARVWLE